MKRRNNPPYLHIRLERKVVASGEDLTAVHVRQPLETPQIAQEAGLGGDGHVLLGVVW